MLKLYFLFPSAFYLMTGTQLHPIVIQIKGYDLVKYEEIKA